MGNDSFKIAPVMITAFNRPEITKIVFEEIRKARPKNFFIHIDGPRPGNLDDEKKIEQVKNIFSKIDWPCKVKKMYHKKNLGCLKSGIFSFNWFFDNVDEGIILEDDAVPSSDFFRFCSELLEKYRYDDRIMHISGCNFQRGWKRDDYSYYFSSYSHMWGYAMWKRSWKKYNDSPSYYLPIKRKGYLKDIYPNFLERYLLEKTVFDKAYSIKNTGCDANWMFTIASNNGLAIIPNKNLITNIGFSKDSTHTKKGDEYSAIGIKRMNFPLNHPFFIIKDRKSDSRYVRWVILNKIKKRILKLLFL
jgi:GR25 family glycosyltransferase involved in LPS biosynthesis